MRLVSNGLGIPAGCVRRYNTPAGTVTLSAHVGPRDYGEWWGPSFFAQRCTADVYRPKSRGGWGRCLHKATTVQLLYTLPSERWRAAAERGEDPGPDPRHWLPVCSIHRKVYGPDDGDFIIPSKFSFTEFQFMSWQQRPATPDELKSMGLPVGTSCFMRRGEDNKGILYAFRFSRPETGWIINLLYVPDGLTGGKDSRSPTYNELLTAKVDLCPPDIMMALILYPADHPEGKLGNRSNLVLWEMGEGRSHGGLILLPGGAPAH